jgi:SAM-dependent methyltransferase
VAIERDEPLSILHRIRAAEIEVVEGWFAPGARVLELGGSDGFQAQLLTNHGCDVSSIDVAPLVDRGYHPVLRYDGETIPFPDASFDVAFSSNVLEHIPHLPKILRELSRVCRPQGYGVHIVPSTAWRFWTNLTHFPWLLQRALRWHQPIPRDEPSFANAMGRNSLPEVLYKLAGLAPHGAHGSALSELRLFSHRHWQTVFWTQGLEIIHESDNSLFYTGHTLLPNLAMTTRRHLANALGAACHVFVVRGRAHSH